MAAVYIMVNKKYGTLYTGVTKNLGRRLREHKWKTSKNSFSAKYNCQYLVYYEYCGSIIRAIEREKTIKKYARCSKIKLIESRNPEWNDLS